jgi:DNA-binding MarR family transcriptional regulator
MTPDRQILLEAFFESMSGFFRLMKLNKEQLAQESGANRSQYELLVHLHHVKHLTIGQIAEQMHMSSSAATQLVEGLTCQGWAEKMADAKDGRRVCINLTAKGQDQALKAKTIFMQHLGTRLSALPDKDLQRITTDLLQLSHVLSDSDK